MGAAGGRGRDARSGRLLDLPHLDHPDLPLNTIETARRWAATLGGLAYVIDDESAICVVDGVVEVVSEGHWERLDPA